MLFLLLLNISYINCEVSQTSPPNLHDTSLPYKQIANKESTEKPTNNTCKIDFKNFSYPWLRSLAAPDNYGKTFTLKDGKLEATLKEDGRVNKMGAFLSSIKYGDLNNDSKDEAVITISFQTGGSAVPHAIYLYDCLHLNQPSLIGSFVTGDRADGGLKRVSIEEGKLIVELFSPIDSQGACCPTKYIRSYYKWDNKHLKKASKDELHSLQ